MFAGMAQVFSAWLESSSTRQHNPHFVQVAFVYFAFGLSILKDSNGPTHRRPGQEILRGQTLVRPTRSVDECRRGVFPRENFQM